MIDAVSSLSGASPRLAETPSLQGLNEGRRSFSDHLSGALPKPEELPSLPGSEGGSRNIRDAVGEKIDAYAAFFVNQMMQAMRSTTLQGDGKGFPHGGRGEQVFQGWQDSELSQKLAHQLKFRQFFGKALDRMAQQASAPVQETSHVA